MKKFNLGFTLAEVLITLSIIGVISAVVMPSVISSYQYKTIGVKLSKFASTVETAARSYVVQNDSFHPTSADEIENFLNESFIFKSVAGSTDDRGRLSLTGDTPAGDDDDDDTSNAARYALAAAGKFGPTAVLKDNTGINVMVYESLSDSYTVHTGTVDRSKVGFPVFEIVFNPAVTGMASTVQVQYAFNVTELGYVFPADDDACLWSIYDADWSSNAATFRNGGACNGDAQQTMVNADSTAFSPVSSTATGDE